MSMPEILHTLENVQKKEHDDKRFLASLQGINLEEEESEQGPSFEEVEAKALGLDTGIANDIVSLRGSLAASKGFGIKQGLGYSENN